MKTKLEDYKVPKPSKEKLLEQYAKKDPVSLIEFDGFSDEKTFDNIVAPDEDGYCLFSHCKWELMRAYWNVRVMIRPDTPKEDILAMLSNITTWISSIEEDEDHKLKFVQITTRLNDIKSLKEGMTTSERPSEKEVIQEAEPIKEDV